MQFPTIFTIISGAILLGISVCSCSNDEEEVHLATLYDVAEVSEKDNNGTQFAVYRPDATTTDAVLLYAPGFSVGDTEVGTSVLMSYIPQHGLAYKSGTIEVQQMSTITNQNLKRGSEASLVGWGEDPVYLLSMWRAGQKVTMRVRLPYSTEPRRFALVVDEATENEAYPEAYLFHQRADITPNFQRQYYAAFNLSELWKMPGCQGLRIHVANSNNPIQSVFTIENPNL